MYIIKLCFCECHKNQFSILYYLRLFYSTVLKRTNIEIIESVISFNMENIMLEGNSG